MALSKQKILAHAGVFKTKEVHVPAWADESGDDVVIVRGLTGHEWDSYQSGLSEEQAGNSNASAELIVKCIVDADGGRVFDQSDAGLVGELPIAELTKLGDAILNLSGLTEASRKAAEGNSAAAKSGNSASSSAETSSTAPSPS
jgi:hypothetical protein